MTTNGDGQITIADPAKRARIITKAIRDITALEADRSTIGEQIRAIKNTQIKGKLGLKIADFNAALRLHSLEDDDRDDYLSTLRETFAALGVGEQLDWLTPVGGDGADKVVRPAFMVRAEREAEAGTAGAEA